MLGVVHPLNNILVEMEGIYKVILCIWDMDKCLDEVLDKIVAYVFMHKNMSFRNYKMFLIIYLNLTYTGNIM